MKKIFLILLAGIISFTSCKNSDKKETTLAGKWKIVEMNISDMDEEEKNEIMNKALLEFSADGKYIATRSASDIINGSYVYNEKEKTLSVSNNEDDGKAQLFTISWENGLLLMTNEEGTVKLKRQ